MKSVEVKYFILFLAMIILMEKSFVSANTVVTYVISDKIPSRARKAGGTNRIPEKTESKISGRLYNEQEVSTINNENTNYDYTSDDENESEEKHCPGNQFWHIRGQRCVPIKCDTKNSSDKRDADTGECLPVYSTNPYIPRPQYTVSRSSITYGTGRSGRSYTGFRG